MNINEMSEKEIDKYLKSITPVLPPWCKQGSVVLSTEEKDFVDRKGNKALVKYVNWRDNKGKEHQSIHWVRWE